MQESFPELDGAQDIAVITGKSRACNADRKLVVSACLQETHAVLDGCLSALELPEDGPKDSSAVDIRQHPRDVGIPVTQDLLP